MQFFFQCKTITSLLGSGSLVQLLSILEKKQFLWIYYLFKKYVFDIPRLIELPITQRAGRQIKSRFMSPSISIPITYMDTVKYHPQPSHFALELRPSQFCYVPLELLFQLLHQRQKYKDTTNFVIFLPKKKKKKL